MVARPQRFIAPPILRLHLMFFPGVWGTFQTTFVAAEQTEPTIQLLDLRERAFVLFTLVTLMLLGLFLILFVILGGRWARRRARWHRGPTSFGGSAGTGEPSGHRSRTSLSSNADGDSISTAETRIDTGIEETRQSEG
ncbi:MAG: hypothetical protein JW829_01280 [Pirellulales bacterium]|nr:hypothetical protein [Pirellulales bacterium]